MLYIRICIRTFLINYRQVEAIQNITNNYTLPLDLESFPDLGIEDRLTVLSLHYLYVHVHVCTVMYCTVQYTLMSSEG